MRLSAANVNKNIFRAARQFRFLTVMHLARL
jgi:hypothetical protein